MIRLIDIFILMKEDIVITALQQSDKLEQFTFQTQKEKNNLRIY